MFADFSTHIGWINSKIRKIGIAISPFEAAASVGLTVRSGLLAGLNEHFTSDKLVVGGADDCDVILLDEGIADHHATLHFQRSAFGVLIAFEALEGSVTVNGTDIPCGACSDYLQLPADLQLADVALLVDRPASQGPSHIPYWTILPVSCVALVLGVAIATGKFDLNPKTSKVSLAQPNENGRLLVAPVAINANEVTPLMQAAQMRLAEVGLAPYLTTTMRNGNTMVISGVLPEALVDDWRHFNRWYDSQTDGLVLVQEITIATLLRDLPPISAVRLSEPHTLMFTDGASATEGDIIAGGWTITAIEPETLTLKRRGEHIEIAF